MNFIYKQTLPSKKGTLFFFMLLWGTATGPAGTPSSLFFPSTGVDPLSKVTITSEKLIIKKKNEELHITYKEKVKITLADGGEATAQKLKITLTDLTRGELPTKMNLDYCKNVSLSGNVRVLHQNRSLEAQTAEIDVKNKTCVLFGNVHIKQEKKQPNDIPLTTTCKQATLNLSTNHISFEGDAAQPVVTTILFADQKKISKP